MPPRYLTGQFPFCCCNFLSPMEGGDEDEAATYRVLNLFDFYWYHHRILGNHRRRVPPPPPSPPPSPPVLDLEADDAASHASEPAPDTTCLDPPLPLPRRHRSLSDEMFPPPSMEGLRIRIPKLQTIFSGEEGEILVTDVAMSAGDGELLKAGRWRRRQRRRVRRGGGSSRSMSELEFEELKGFMDLGFTFTDAETDPRLMSIVPGLQRLRAAPASDAGSPAGGSPAASDGTADEPAVLRPYLSEAWDAAAEEAERDRVRNWRVPANGEGVDMKNRLRCWAHAVASTVR